MDAAGARRYARRMSPDAPSAEAEPPITQLLRQAARGDRSALDSIYASLYPELKRVARARLRQQGRADDMDTTTLVHESFVRLVNASDLRLEDRRHFFAYAARRCATLIDAAREHLAERRGGGAEHLTLGDGGADEVADARESDELIRVNDAAATSKRSIRSSRSSSRCATSAATARSRSRPCAASPSAPCDATGQGARLVVRGARQGLTTRSWRVSGAGTPSAIR